MTEDDKLAAFAALVRESLRRVVELGPEEAMRLATSVEELRALELATGMLMERGN